MRLYLASTSPARLQTLRAAGVEPITVAPGVDEEAAVAAREQVTGPLSPAEMVQLLAQAKAEALVGASPGGEPIDGFILGGDSAFVVDGAIHGKPHTADVAKARWLAQNGAHGDLWSGHWLIDHRGGRVRGAVGRADVATVRFAATRRGRDRRVHRVRASRCSSPGRSRSTASAGRSSAASRATPRPSSGSRCRRCATWCANSAASGRRSGTAASAELVCRRPQESRRSFCGGHPKA